MLSDGHRLFLSIAAMGAAVLAATWTLNMAGFIGRVDSVTVIDVVSVTIALLALGFSGYSALLRQRPVPWSRMIIASIVCLGGAVTINVIRVATSMLEYFLSPQS